MIDFFFLFRDLELKLTDRFQTDIHASLVVACKHSWAFDFWGEKGHIFYETVKGLTAEGSKVKPFLRLDPQKGSRWPQRLVHCRRQELRVRVSLRVAMCPDCRHHACASLLLRLISTPSLMHRLFKDRDVVALRCCVSLCSSAKWMLRVRPMLFGCPSCWGHRALSRAPRGTRSVPVSYLSYTQ